MNLLIPQRCLAAALLVVGIAASSGAQEPRRLSQPDSIPMELATALISSGGLPGDPQILVGSLPGWMTNRIYIAPNARVVGSAFIGTTAVAIVSSPDMPEPAMAALKRELATRGWKTPPPQPSYGGGFRSATMNMMPGGDPTRATLCGADQQMLTTSAVRRRWRVDGHRDADLDHWRLRHLQSASDAGGIPAAPPWPTMYHPAGVSDANQACNGDNSFGSGGPSAIVRTPITSEALLDHYAKQLQDSGWQAPPGSGSIIGRTWTRTDSTGAPVELTITAAASLRDPSCRTLNMVVRTLKKP